MARRRLTVEVDEVLHGLVRVEARERGMSMEAFAGRVLAEGMENLRPAAQVRLTFPYSGRDWTREQMEVRSDLLNEPEPPESPRIPSGQYVCEGSHEPCLPPDLAPDSQFGLGVWRCSVCGHRVSTVVTGDEVLAVEHYERPDPASGYHQRGS